MQIVTPQPTTPPAAPLYSPAAPLTTAVQPTAPYQPAQPLQPTTAAVEPATAQPALPVQTEPPASSAPPAQPSPANPPAQPTYTPLPTYTPYPTQAPYTPLPTTTPQLIQPVQPVYYPSPTPSYASNQPVSGCCTLRVRNLSSRTLWIGSHLPYGGNDIPSLWYIEFYPSQPGPLRVYWCRYSPYTGYHYDCRDVVFQVHEGLTQVAVPYIP